MDRKPGRPNDGASRVITRRTRLTLRLPLHYVAREGRTRVVGCRPGANVVVWRSVYRRPWGAFRAKCWIAAAIALALAAAGCTALRGEPVAGAPAGTTVIRLTGVRPASIPPDPRLASPSVNQLEGSLRRIVVSYVKITAWDRTEPRPLLSDQQIRDYAQILARELPTLRDTQRLRFTFTDRYFGRQSEVEFDVYREGDFLVYWFNELAYDPTLTATTVQTVGKDFMAMLEPSPGQEVVNSSNYAYVKDPLLGEERALAAEREAKRQQFEQARKAGDFDPAETERLTDMMARPQPDAAAWKSYWERRHTLKTALEQRLLDRAAYQAQVERLNAGMEMPETVSAQDRAVAAEQEQKRQLFEQARNAGDFEPDETGRLTALMARPQPDAAAWKE